VKGTRSSQGQCYKNRACNFLVFGVAAKYNIFFCGESLRVQAGGLGGSAENELMAFQLHLNIRGV